ncbi:hypothetical protein GJ496_004434 [Pomphorhynchus laevis]|nr:hypothetical protein GJ496_004434 [Pomphorhynchus laevis]
MTTHLSISIVPSKIELKSLIIKKKVEISRPVSVFNLFIEYWKCKLTNEFKYLDAIDAYAKMSGAVKSKWKLRADEVNNAIDEYADILNLGSSTVLNTTTLMSNKQYINDTKNTRNNLVLSEFIALNKPVQQQINSVSTEEILDSAAYFMLLSNTTDRITSIIKASIECDVNRELTKSEIDETVNKSLDYIYTWFAVSTRFLSQLINNNIPCEDDDTFLDSLSYTTPNIIETNELGDDLLKH